MFKAIAKKRRLARIIEYLKQHPEDEPAVKAIMAGLDIFHIKSAREAAELTAGNRFTDEQWQKISPRWERAWYFIVR